MGLRHYTVRSHTKKIGTKRARGTIVSPQLRGDSIMFAIPLLLTLAAAQPANPVVPLWDGKAPHAVGDSDTDKPSLKVFKAEKPNGTAVVICPGGGYGFLADDHEGQQVAEWLNTLGVIAFVL